MFHGLILGPPDCPHTTTKNGENRHGVVELEVVRVVPEE